MKRAVAALLTGVTLFGLAACERQEEPMGGKQYLFYAFEVPVYTVLYTNFEDEEKEKAAQNAVAELSTLFSEIEQSLSVAIPTSSIARFNAAKAGETVTIDETAYTVLTIAREMYELTDGAYNPAVGLSVDLWGFTPRFREADYVPSEPYDRPVDADGAFSSLPDPAYVSAFAALSDFSAVELREEGGVYTATKPKATAQVAGMTYSMRLDLGGIGKGYAADRGAELLRARGYTKGYLNVGSSSLALFESQDEAADYTWNLGCRHPRKSGTYLQLFVKNACVASSGDYENYYLLDGVRYCHIIDPFTGAPIRGDIVTATVCGLPAAQADALSTALCVLGTERAISFINRYLSDVTVAFVRYHEALDRYEILTNAETYEADESFVVASRVENGVLEYAG